MIQNTNYGASKTYVNTKVDKLTTSGLKAYTHDGATQGEIDVSNTYTPLTLALRDSNGRLIAADPASGATDKTLVTANWVSQTGNNAPNNLVHKSGNETVDGIKSMMRPICGGYLVGNGALPGETGEYIRLLRMYSYSQAHVMIYGNTPNNGLGFAEMIIGGSDQFNRSYPITKQGSFNTAQFLRVSAPGYNELWVKKTSVNLCDTIVIHSTTNVIYVDQYAATGLTEQPAIGDTNPITGETINGVSVI